MKKIKSQKAFLLSIAITAIAALTVGCSLGAGTPGYGPVNLGAAGNYVILAKSAVSVKTTSVITGDIGLSPAAETYLTGFSQSNATVYATSAQVTGKLYAADMASPTPTNLTTAVSDMETAYTDASTRTESNYKDLGAGNIGGMTLVPGLYNWGTGLSIPTDVTLFGNGVYIFQIAQDLTVASAAKVILTGGALPENIIWAVGGIATLGTTCQFKGIILCKTQINLKTNAVLTGRALAQSQVTLDSNTVTAP